MVEDECPCVDIEMDYDERPKFSHRKWRRARKPHVCCECRGAISKGDGYEYVVGIWGDKWLTFKTCEGCRDIRGALFCGGWTYGQMYEDLVEFDMVDFQVDTPPAGCVITELTEIGARKLKAYWAERVGLKG